MDVTDDDRATLRALNNAVEEAMERRRAWVAAKCVELAGVKIGEELYNLDTLKPVGIVRSINPYHDHILAFYYEYEERPHSFDNTSRQWPTQFGSLADAQAVAKRRLRRLEAPG